MREVPGGGGWSRDQECRRGSDEKELPGESVRSAVRVGVRVAVLKLQQGGEMLSRHQRGNLRSFQGLYALSNGQELLEHLPMQPFEGSNIFFPVH